jgi:GntR family transcriptional regulator
MIEFYIDSQSGVPPYLQLIQQVRRTLKLGFLKEGDQLPTVKEVVGRIAINPNTVSKAYRELEHEGLVAPRIGVGTFIVKSLSDASLSAHRPLRHDLQRWFESARRAGLDDESIDALIRECFRATSGTVVA